ncbi:uncharacterized protein LOC116160449 [Photinus pyralis]|uniref:uncharacterized protein LOC116160449 n=1 Tax=Photinus pyralis TaxID=7054 RepID=UPI001266F4A6|nr:uncharacterized protein LOC116160449 [Photinus pyralis]
MMKYIVVLLLCASVQNSSQNMFELLKYKNECSSESGIGKAMKSMLKEIMAGEFPSFTQVTGFPLCMMTKIGFMDKDGNVNPDALKKYVGLIPNGNDILAVVSGCKDAKGTLPEKAYEICQCVFQGAFKKVMGT